MRTVLTVLAAAGLGACTDLGPGDADPVRAIALLGGSVVAAAPEGYCLDTRSSRASQGFAVMAGCALVSSEASLPSVDGLLTLQVGEAGTALVRDEAEMLRALLATPEGAALLSASGDPAAIAVDALESRDGVVYVHFTDAAAPPTRGMERIEWRAFFDIGDRLATLSLRGFDRAPIGKDSGLRLLRAAVSGIRAANPTAI